MQTMYSCGCMYHMGKPPASIGGEQEISNRGRGQSPSDKRSARMRRDSAAQLISPHMRLNLRLWISAICLIRVKLLCKQACSGFLLVTHQPFGFTVTTACTQTAILSVWRLQSSGSRCKCSGTPRGTVSGCLLLFLLSVAWLNSYFLSNL